MASERTDTIGSRLVAILLFALALGLRLFHLDHQSLWHDEAFTILVARKDFGAMVYDLVADFNHPPLHYVVVHFVFRLLGESVFVARLPSAIVGAAAVPLLFLLGRRLYDARTGLLAAALLLVSQQALVLSQTARGYSQLLFFALAAELAFLIALRERKAMAWWWAVVCATLALYSHFYAVFVLAGCLGFLLWAYPRYSLRPAWTIGGIALAAALALPWLASGVLEEARSGPDTSFMQQSIWRRSNLLSLPNTLDAFNNGRVEGIYEDSPWWGLALGALLFSLPALLATRPLWRRGRPSEGEPVVFLLCLTALPLGAAWVLGDSGLAYRDRYVCFALPTYYLLVARGLFSLEKSIVRRVAITSCLAFTLFAARAALFLPYRAQYAEALSMVERGWRDGDALVFSPWGEPREWELYRGDHQGLRTLPFPEVADGGGACERVWLLTYLKPGARGRAYRNLARFEKHWQVLERHEVYLVDVGLYRRLERGER